MANARILYTWLPYADFAQSAACLEPIMLNRQKEDALIVLQVCLDCYVGDRKKKTNAWVNHPCVRMWKPWPYALAVYGLYMCKEWQDRGLREFTASNRKVVARKPAEGFLQLIEDNKWDGPPEIPPWLGNEALHSSHRAALLKKNPGWYGQFNWTEKPYVDLEWPVWAPDPIKVFKPEWHRFQNERRAAARAEREQREQATGEGLM